MCQCYKCRCSCVYEVSSFSKAECYIIFHHSTCCHLSVAVLNQSHNVLLKIFVMERLTYLLRKYSFYKLEK